MNSAGIDGLIVIDKPAGISSARLVAKIKGLAQAEKVGHTGTLDPFATGVMVCCINQATRLSRFYLHGPKKYEALVHLGVDTDTFDVTGSVTGQREVAPISKAALQKVLGRFEGTIEQVPPEYSALKHKGVPLYKLARKGRAVQKPARVVKIDYIKLVALELPYVLIEISCSAGTYIRSLARDIGQALGCGAHLKALRRTESAGFTLDEALGLEEARQMASDGRLKDRIVRMADLLPDMPAFVANKDLKHKVGHGIRVTVENIPLPRLDADTKHVKVIDAQKRLLAVLNRPGENGIYTYCCVFPD